MNSDRRQNLVDKMEDRTKEKKNRERKRKEKMKKRKWDTGLVGYVTSLNEKDPKQTILRLDSPLKNMCVLVSVYECV